MQDILYLAGASLNVNPMPTFLLVHDDFARCAQWIDIKRGSRCPLGRETHSHRLT
jgi:hypothetical protein